LLNTVLGSLSSGVAAATGSYESIASATGTGSSATISVSSIPSTYASLQVRATFKAAGTGFYVDDLLLRLNSDTGSNYTKHILQGNGSTASAVGIASTTNIDCGRILSSDSALANMTTTVIIDILDYASTSKYKTVRIFSGDEGNINDGSFRVFLASGLWQSTSAITSLTFSTSAALNFTSATQVALYGIKGA
jgi:hypothetical protein